MCWPLMLRLNGPLTRFGLAAPARMLCSAPRTVFFQRMREKHPRKVGALRLGLRLFRTTTIGTGLLGAGYTYGIMTYAWNPDEVTNGIISGLVKSRSNQEEEPFLPKDSPEHRRAVHVAQRVVSAAKDLAREHVSRSQNETDQDAPPDERLPDMDAAHWREALRRLESGEWHVHVLNDDQVESRAWRAAGRGQRVEGSG